MFSKFNLLTGVQCTKLHAHIKEKYEIEKKYINNVLWLYIVLHENEKNNLEKEIDLLLRECEEEDRINFCVQLLDKDNHFSNEAKKEWKDMLIQFIKEGKVKRQVPKNILEKLTFDDTCMRRFLLTQCIRNTGIRGEFVEKAFGIYDIRVVDYFCSTASILDRQEVKITDQFSYCFYEISSKNLAEFKNLANKLELKDVVKMCDFFADPSYARYRELLCITDDEERTIVKNNIERLYTKYEEKTENEFRVCMEDRRRNLQLFRQQNIKELMRNDKCYGLGYTVMCAPSVFDDLMEKQSYLEDIHILGDTFLCSFAFVAAVQIESWDSSKTVKKVTVNRMIQLLAEINQRKLYVHRIFSIIVFVLNTKYYAKLQYMIQNLEFVENMTDEQVINEILYQRSWGKSDEKTEKIISIVVRYTINLAKENNYLLVLLRIFAKDHKFSAGIPSDDMMELEQIECRNEYNKLTVYLLKLCNSEDENIETLIECIVNLKVDKKLLYSVILNILRNCEMTNRDKAWTLFYFRLEQEDFEGQKELLNELIDNMIEIKGNSIM